MAGLVPAVVRRTRGNGPVLFRRVIGRSRLPKCSWLPSSAQMHGDGDRAAQAVARLAGSSQARVAEEIADCMEDRVAGLWENGWQPCDLDRVVDGRLRCHEARWCAGSSPRSL